MKYASIAAACLMIVSMMCSSPKSITPDNTISVGCMERAKNLNPFLAQSEIELTLQQLVFPPLIADFGGKKQQDDSLSFYGILIDDDNIIDPRPSSKNILDFKLERIGRKGIPPLEINPDDVVNSVERLNMLGERSNFSFNLDKAEKNSNNPRIIRIFYGTKNNIGKRIATTFPLVKFSAFESRWKWGTSDQTLVTPGDRYKLVGYSDYCYEDIFSKDTNVITLAPVEADHTQDSPKLHIKAFPDYNQMINSLRGIEIQCAFNLSALTDFNSPDISWADMQFGRQSILYLEVTDKGRQIGLDKMSVINLIREQFKTFFREQKIINDSGWVYQFDSILNENIPIPQSMPLNDRLDENVIKLRYVQSTINEKVVETLRKVFKEMEYTLETKAVDMNVAESKLNSEDFHLVIKSHFINTPEFLNLKFYYNYPGIDPRHENAIIDILRKNGETSSLNNMALILEREIVSGLPIVFLVRYHTRVAYRTQDLKMNINDERGAPFFFHNLSQWGTTQK